MSFLRFEKILEISKIFKRAKNSTSTRYLQESLSSRNFRKISYLLRFKSYPRNSKFVPTKENEGKNAGCIDIGMFFFSHRLHYDSIDLDIVPHDPWSPYIFYDSVLPDIASRDPEEDPSPIFNIIELHHSLLRVVAPDIKFSRFIRFYNNTMFTTWFLM